MREKCPPQKDFIEWGPEIEVGVADIDGQHRQLVVLVNRLAATVTMDAATDKIVGAVAMLLDGSRAHFDFEEALMRRVGYSGLTLHQEQHSELLASMERLREQLASGRQAANMLRTLDFMRDWLLTHILHSDSDLADFLKTRFAPEILA